MIATVTSALVISSPLELGVEVGAQVEMYVVALADRLGPRLAEVHPRGDQGGLPEPDGRGREAVRVHDDAPADPLLPALGADPVHARARLHPDDLHRALTVRAREERPVHRRTHQVRAA